MVQVGYIISFYAIATTAALGSVNRVETDMTKIMAKMMRWQILTREADLKHDYY